ncbi:MAG: hypothetical protein P9L99_04775 [Candidatus Lernaella stagnicola]|nr:hypothetical protein [Candidatus Lernaella stagnicola]
MGKWLFTIYVIVIATFFQTLANEACAKTTYGQALDGYQTADFLGAPEITEKQALIILLRPEGKLAGAPYRVKMEGELAGYVQGGRFIYAYVNPGETRINADGAMLQFDVWGGRVYYVALQIKLDHGKAYTHLRVVSADEAFSLLDKPDFRVMNDPRLFVPPTARRAARAGTVAHRPTALTDRSR